MLLRRNADYLRVRCTMLESKKVVGDDAIMVNPTMLASWGIESPLKECPRRGRRMISTASSPRTVLPGGDYVPHEESWG